MDDSQQKPMGTQTNPTGGTQPMGSDQTVGTPPVVEVPPVETPATPAESPQGPAMPPAAGTTDTQVPQDEEKPVGENPTGGQTTSGI